MRTCWLVISVSSPGLSLLQLMWLIIGFTKTSKLSTSVPFKTTRHMSAAVSHPFPWPRRGSRSMYYIHIYTYMVLALCTHIWCLPYVYIYGACLMYTYMVLVLCTHMVLVSCTHIWCLSHVHIYGACLMYTYGACLMYTYMVLVLCTHIWCLSYVHIYGACLMYTYMVLVLCTHIWC